MMKRSRARHEIRARVRRFSAKTPTRPPVARSYASSSGAASPARTLPASSAGAAASKLRLSRLIMGAIDSPSAKIPALFV